MLVRILTGIVAFFVFLPFLIFSETVALPFAMAVCGMISVFELLRCVGVHRNLWVIIPLELATAACPFAMRYWGADKALSLVLGGALVLTLYMLAVAVFSHGKVDITQSATAFAVSMYIIAAFSCMVFLCDNCPKNLYLLVFFGAWVPDTFAYFTGKLFGRHKLIPDVSPKKTVEGAIGGVVFCILAFIGFGLVYNYLNTDLVGTEGYRALPIWLMAVAGLLSALVSMVGDLAMSVIKRHYGVKDYGKILPGHGGFLDRFDSVLAVAVILAVAFGVAVQFGVM